MNARKQIDYSAMYTELDELMEKSLPQVELYCEIGRLVCSRPEKGTAIMASEYLRDKYPDVAGFSPRNVRRMREFFRTYGSNEALMAETMKIGWTQNVLIMERCADDAERQWYLQAVARLGWSKLELAAKIDDAAHLKMSITPQEEVCYIEDREAGGVGDAELSHKFVPAPPDGCRTPGDEEQRLRPKVSGPGNVPYRLRNNSLMAWGQPRYYSRQDVSIVMISLVMPKYSKVGITAESGP